MKSAFSSPVIRGALFLLVLIGLSFAPAPLKGRLATIGTLHHFAHIAIFFIGFFVIGSGRPGRLAIALVIVGALIELFQTAVYGNLLEYEDILDDATGVALGFLCQRLVGVRYTF